ncbi:MAG: ATP-binding protein [Chloroflexi bacterium]|nr:ATP-binding protein [Chloroflexota bacterium]
MIAVTDTGFGESPRAPAASLQRFYRVPQQAGAARVSGTGLGLAIVKLIVELHDGTVSVESEVGVGGQFTIRLPR